MSATKFSHKRAGYLAASQSFHEGTELLMLATNMIRKDLCSVNQYESSLALTGNDSAVWFNKGSLRGP